MSTTSGEYLFQREGGDHCSRGVLRTDVDGTLSDHGTVSLEDDSVDLLEVVRVRDDLVAGKEVLLQRNCGVSDGILSAMAGQRGAHRPVRASIFNGYSYLVDDHFGGL